MDKELYFNEFADKQMLILVDGTKIAFDNSMIESEAFEMDESLCSESELKFGTCETNSVKFTVHDTPGSIVGKSITITETVDGDTDNPFQYGTYKVYSDVPSSDRTKREITAYDAMYDIINADVKSWYAGLNFPMTLKQFRDSFFAYMEIKQENVTLANDSMTVNKTLVATQTDDSSTVTEESSISGKTVVTAICEINGCFGNISRDGKFEYVFLKEITSALYPREDLFPADSVFPSDANTESMTGHYISFDYEDFQSKAITQLEIRVSDSSAGMTVGTSGNNYVISGNFLVSDKTGTELEQIANNILPVMKRAEYIPIKSCTCVGNPCLMLGEPIRFNTTREIVETYLLQRTLSGIQCKRDSIMAQGTEMHTARVNSIRDAVESVERRTNKLERTADHMISELADLDTNTSSRFEQTSDLIQAEVTARQGADAEMSTKISQTAHSISLTASGGEQSVGITIQLLDENGNIIDMSSGNANITITGVVKFVDLAQAGATVINGENITTGIIRSSDSEFTRAKFYDGIYYALNYRGSEYTYPVIVVTEPGMVTYGVSAMHTEILGSVNFPDTRVYINNTRVATVNDVPTDLGVNDVSYTYMDSNTTKYAPRIFRVAGRTLYATGYLVSTSGSDRRLKREIMPLRDISALYMRMQPVEYRWDSRYVTKQKGLQFGLVAQDLENELLESGLFDSGLVLKENAEDDEREIHGDDITYKIDKENLHAMHIQMIQKQQREIEQLQFDNFAMRGEIDILKQRLHRLEEKLC